MNMVLTLSVYATICKELGLPFVFPGSVEQWNFITDVTDADLLGEQLVWAATNPAAENEAFNIANGDVFRWRWLWPQIAEHFGLAWEGPTATPRTLEASMTDIAPELWRRIAEREGLVEADVTKLASWWHSDSDLGREVECLTDMTKSKEAGFLGFRSTPKSYLDNVARYREAAPHPLRLRHRRPHRALDRRGELDVRLDGLGRALRRGERLGRIIDREPLGHQR